MMRMPNDMQKLKIALSVAVLLWTCSIAIMLLSGCAGLRPFPVKDLYEFDPKTPACAHYVITDYTNLKFKWVEDIPFVDCPAIFGFLSSDIPKVFNWGQDSIQYGKTHCK